MVSCLFHQKFKAGMSFASLIFILFKINMGLIFFQLITQTFITWSGMNRNWNSWYDLRGQLADFATTTKYNETWFTVSSYGRINWRYQQTAWQFWMIFWIRVQTATTTKWNITQQNHNDKQMWWSINIRQHTKQQNNHTTLPYMWPWTMLPAKMVKFNPMYCQLHLQICLNVCLSSASVKSATFCVFPCFYSWHHLICLV